MNTTTTQDDVGGFASISSTDLVAEVEAQLIHAIAEGRLPPGGRIVEADLARRMGISRAPVREAARRLERQGIVVARPRHGFTVRTITASEIDDLYQVRLHMELQAVELACRNADDAGMQRLQAALARMVAGAATTPQTQRVMRDLEFHTLICELSGNGYLLRLFMNMRTELRMIMALIELAYQDPQRVAETHQPIVDCLRRRDVDAASAAMRLHLEDARLHVRALYQEKHGVGEQPPACSAVDTRTAA
ncbi:GntR family transcriptional regulator [Bordetella genomosp. 11]|uniref:GntR family transcriptional regulator n=1 Tax=Bordetella genomosp. 11 TaxID=1416808 RepID=A0A261UIL6_9BORD|nr:GntR family transcriptional regulator [Bordetella genomosp. 11]OZI61766.1 GntR family transcriptional regulator [Bordetella genomosp. 11]